MSAPTNTPRDHEVVIAFTESGEVAATASGRPPGGHQLGPREWEDDFGQVLTGVHRAEGCVAPCAIHSPSDHSMRRLPLRWRSDRRILERVCQHGTGHPDPDGRHVDRDTGELVPDDTVHGCCGCCAS